MLGWCWSYPQSSFLFYIPDSMGRCFFLQTCLDANCRIWSFSSVFGIWVVRNCHFPTTICCLDPTHLCKHILCIEMCFFNKGLAHFAKEQSQVQYSYKEMVIVIFVQTENFNKSLGFHSTFNMLIKHLLYARHYSINGDKVIWKKWN